jgi:AraC-like DNA-binding protein
MAAAPQRFRFATTDPDEGSEIMRTLLGSAPRLRSGMPQYQMDIETFLGDRVSTGRMRLDAEVTSDGVSETEHIVLIPTAGSYELTHPSERVEIGPGGVLLMDAGVRHEAVSRHASFDLLTVRAALMNSIAEEWRGRRAGRPSAVPVDEPLADHVRRIASWYEDEVLSREEIYGSPILREQGERMVATAVAAAFGFLQFDGSVPADGGPAALRRAIAFMEERAGDPISTTEIAAAARLSARGLQAMFQRVLGSTPNAELRRIRLARVREELLAAPGAPGEVALIARRWGFAHLGRFAEYYRTEYGERPSETLGRVSL